MATSSSPEKGLVKPPSHPSRCAQANENSPRNGKRKRARKLKAMRGDVNGSPPPGACLGSRRSGCGHFRIMCCGSYAWSDLEIVTQQAPAPSRGTRRSSVLRTGRRLEVSQTMIGTVGRQEQPRNLEGYVRSPARGLGVANGRPHISRIERSRRSMHAARGVSDEMLDGQVR